MTKTWIKPDLNRARATKQVQLMRQFKVIRIYWTLAEGKHEAITWIAENEPNPDVEFAVEEQPKGWFGAMLKQMFG